MSNSFNSFLGAHGNTIFKSYSHAEGLYVDNNYARAPKLGFLYFVVFNIRRETIKDQFWAGIGRFDVGLLVKKIDMPKFKITTETENQYNRKTVVQTKLEYQPVSIEFHDDNSEITNGLWKNYYKYYYADSLYGDKANGIRDGFNDTKYKLVDNPYGLDNGQKNPFFDSIDIFVLHQQKFTQMSLINPLVTSWDHDGLDQSQGGAVLKNKMNVVYENVIYKQGQIVKGDNPPGFAASYYDNISSPLSVGGSTTNAELASQGLAPGEQAVFNSAPRGSPNYVIPNTKFPAGPSQSQLDKVNTQAQGSYNGPTLNTTLPNRPNPLGFAINTGVQSSNTQIQANPVNLNK